MAKYPQTRIILGLVLGLPLVLVAFLYLFSKPVYHSVPYIYEQTADGDSAIRTLPEEIQLYDVEGNSWDAQSLEGNLLLINFFSARDDSASKRTVLHGNLRRIYDNVKWEDEPKLRFLSISTGDSLADLQAYAPQMEDVDPRYWPILHGDSATIYRLATALGNRRILREGPDFAPFTGFYVYLIDKEGQLRDEFIGTNLQEERKLQETLVALWRLEYTDEIGASPLQSIE